MVLLQMLVPDVNLTQFASHLLLRFNLEIGLLLSVVIVQYAGILDSDGNNCYKV
jgi:hypothetical protein